MDKQRYKRYLEEGDEMITKRTSQRYEELVNRAGLQTSLGQNAANSRNSFEDTEDTIVSIEDDARHSEFIQDDSRSQSMKISDNIELDRNIEENFEHLLFGDNVQEDDYVKRPRNLLDFINSDEFSEKINTPVDRTKGEIFLMVLKFSLTNNLALTGLTNLFKLINAMFSSPILPDSRYIIDNLLNPKDEASFHAVCHNCSAYIGEFGKIENIQICTTCSSKLNLANVSDTSYFLLLNPSKQISNLLNIHENHYDYVVKERVHELGHIKDVYDGQMYRQFVNSLPENEKERYVTAVFNTDGAVKFENSQSSVWPLYLMINELPVQSRLTKIVTCGLWFNKKKPEMSVYLDKFVDLINDVNETGISCNIKSEERNLKLYVLTCCVDSVARAPIQGIKQFNGHFGCNWCLHPGEWKLGTMKYPVLTESVEVREHGTMIEKMLIATPDNPIEGIKCPSALINLPHLDIVSGFIVDYLHNTCRGIVEQFTDYHLKSLDDDQIAELDLHIQSFAVPHQISRLSRKISQRNDWNAREWENYLLYYSVPILSLFLDQPKLEHWLLLVESLYILLQDDILIPDLDKADRMLHEFIVKSADLYGIKAMSFNAHLLLHISTCVLNWGPLWAQSTFPFESANRYLLQTIKCARGVTQQLSRLVHINHSIIVLQEYVYPEACEIVKFYCDDILANRMKNVFKISGITYFGLGDSVSQNLLDELHLCPESTKQFSKIVKDSCVYQARSKTQIRSNNSFAQLRDGKFICVFKFIVDLNANIELTVCKVVNTEDSTPVKYDKLRKITSIDEEPIVIHTDQICKICVVMEVASNTYIIPVPNLLHY